jgi:carbamoyltransferase
MSKKYVLGINCHAHDSSAALLSNGEVVFAATEERFSRIKKDRSFPRLTIQAALDHAGIRFADLQSVAFGWNKPGLGPLHTIRRSLTGDLPLTWGWTGAQLVHLASEVRHKGGLSHLERQFGRLGRDRVHYIDHHESHAWSAYALSPFDDALVLVVDGWGAWQSTSIYAAKGNQLTPLRVFPYPNSLGVLYEGFTDLLGFERMNDEWKVMGLAAYGEPNVDLQGIARVLADGYQVDGKVLSGNSYGDLSLLASRFGPRQNPEKEITDYMRNLAASVQKALEEAMFALVREGVNLTGSRNLCLAGGVAMNSKANGKILASGLIDDIFVQPAATDDGAAIGAAFGVYAARGEPMPRNVMEHAYLGPSADDAENERTLRTYKLPVVRVDDVAAQTARLLAQGKIVGWCQGRMEFGPRALGNRSILADPRDPAMKDRVNECVKFREGWRPFAPSCLAERAHEYFQPAHSSPFMILTFDVVPEMRSVIPAVTHADNSARVQTVRRDVNPLYWQLISEFEKLTGVPVVMNTSFNLRGEPIVCTPKDAIRTFYSSGLDFLVLGNHIVAKDRSWQPAAFDAPVALAVGT